MAVPECPVVRGARGCPALTGHAVTKLPCVWQPPLHFILSMSVVMAEARVTSLGDPWLLAFLTSHYFALCGKAAHSPQPLLVFRGDLLL